MDPVAGFFVPESRREPREAVEQNRALVEQNRMDPGLMSGEENPV